MWQRVVDALDWLGRGQTAWSLGRWIALGGGSGLLGAAVAWLDGRTWSEVLLVAVIFAVAVAVLTLVVITIKEDTGRQVGSTRGFNVGTATQHDARTSSGRSLVLTTEVYSDLLLVRLENPGPQATFWVEIDVLDTNPGLSRTQPRPAGRPLSKC